ncbi:MAG: rhodanese-like domain-containing protein [Desulfuromonadales bacterium]|jgi:rhodanese-related sulfurtransferase
MTVDQLVMLLHRKTAPLLLDVRTHAEYAAGHIPRSVHAPLAAIAGILAKRKVAKSDLLVLVCEHGPRAGLVRAYLRLRGYRKIVLLRGHMTHWRQAGLPLEKSPGA